MKSNTKIPTDSFLPTEDDILLMDTNILIKLLYPIDFQGSIDSYAKLFERIKKVHSNLIISSIQISEFINRCIRFQYSLYKDKIGNTSLDFKKEYRGTEDYRVSMEAILDIVKNDIIGYFKFIDDKFCSMRQDKIFIYGFSYDFNDSVVVEIARMNNAIIVTDDVDFGNYGNDFKIITSNRLLLKFK